MSKLKRVVGLGAALSTTAAALMMGVSPASATTNVVVSAGSDTIEGFDLGLIHNPGANQYVVRAAQATPLSVPGDAGAGVAAITYHTPAGAGEVLAPNGSGNGVKAVGGTYAGVPLSSVSIGRSSRGPAAGDPSGLEFVAFARDAVSWASPSLQAPAVIDFTVLQSVYSCIGLDWSSLPGGGSGAIIPYIPQNGSGTRSTFLTWLGVPNPALGSEPACWHGGNNNGGFVGAFEENQGRTILATEYQNALLPYSAGKWSFQTNNKLNPSLDTRNDTRLGNVVCSSNPGLVFKPANYSTASGLFGANPTYNLPTCGAGGATPTRLLYHVLNPNANATGYAQAKSLVGIGSPLCTNGQGAAIRSAGFSPIPAVAGVTCTVTVSP